MEDIELTTANDVVTAQVERLRQLPVYIPDNVRVHFHFSPHHTAEHVGDPGTFRSLVRSSDILFVEQAATFDKTDRVTLTKISKGNTNAFRAFTSITCARDDLGFMDSHARALFNSHVVVDCIDAGSEPSTLFSVRRLMGSTSDGENVGFVNVGDDVDEYVDLSLRQMQNWAIANDYREQLMLAKIGPETSRLIDSNPRLKSKVEVSVLLTLGAAHTRVYHELDKLYPDRITRSLNELPYNFGPRSQHLRSKLFGIQLDQQTEERLVIDTYFHGWARDFLPEIGIRGDLTSATGNKFIRDLSCSLSDEEKKYFVHELLSKDKNDEVIDTFLSKLVAMLDLRLASKTDHQN